MGTSFLHLCLLTNPEPREHSFLMSSTKNPQKSTSSSCFCSKLLAKYCNRNGIDLQSEKSGDSLIVTYRAQTMHRQIVDRFQLSALIAFLATLETKAAVLTAVQRGASHAQHSLALPLRSDKASTFSASEYCMGLMIDFSGWNAFAVSWLTAAIHTTDALPTPLRFRFAKFTVLLLSLDRGRNCHKKP